MWHPDIIHAVEDDDCAQHHPANVVYTASLPMCPLNARYLFPLHFLFLSILFLSEDVCAHVFLKPVVFYSIFSLVIQSTLSYLVRQRTAFLDGTRPPDFCEGANEKTCCTPPILFLFSLKPGVHRQ
jgi:hypothetical protein